MPIILMLCGFALWLAAAFVALAGSTDIHLGFAMVTAGLGVAAIGLAGVCERLDAISKRLRDQ